jgi:molybdopterin converting factor small subunit
MSVSVRLSTTLRDSLPGYSPAEGLSLEIDGETPALELALSLKLPLSEIKIVVLNGRRVSLEAIVKDGDRLAFFPAVGGGSGC